MKIDFDNTQRMFFNIKEVASHFDVNPSLLRYWETQFDLICPRKTDTGTRQYTRQDIGNIAIVYNLVKEKGLTLEGAQQVLKRNLDEEARKTKLLERLERIRKELKALDDELEG